VLCGVAEFCGVFCSVMKCYRSVVECCEVLWSVVECCEEW